MAAALLGGMAILGVYRNPGSWLVRGLELWPLKALGRVSYGFYLYHDLLPRHLVLKLSALAGHPVHPGVWGEAAGSFLFSLGMAALSWALIEKPLLRLKDRPPAWASWLRGAETSRTAAA